MKPTVVTIAGAKESLQRPYKLPREASEPSTTAPQAKSEFLEQMSHELRTPLNIIIGFSELMLDGVPGKVNEEQMQCLKDILDSGTQLLELVDVILDLSTTKAAQADSKSGNGPKSVR